MSVLQTHAYMVTVLMLSMVTYVTVNQDMKEHIVMLVGVMYYCIPCTNVLRGGYYGLVVVTPRPQTFHRLCDNLKNP